MFSSAETSTLLCAGLGLLFVATWLGLSSNRKRAFMQFVPMPDGASWIWGHEKIIFDSSTSAAYSRWYETLGTYVIRIRGALWKPDILVVADPAAISHIMGKQIYNYEHNDIVRPRIARLLGKSLGWVEGESEHKRMRHLVASSLSQEAVKKGYQDILDAAENTRVAMEDYLHSSGAYTEFKTTNITEWTLQATLDAIGRFGFGHNFGGGRSKEASALLGAWRDMATSVTSPDGFIAVMLIRRFGWINNLPLRALRAQGNVRGMIHAGVAKEMVLRDKNIDSGSVPANDLLARLLVAHKNGAIDKAELMDHISMFIMAGSETTGQGVGSAIYELGRNPAVQAKLREEIMRFSNDPTFEELTSKMPYLDAVTRETLRFHPPVPYMERNSKVDDVLPLRHPITDKQGRVHTEIPIVAGQTVIIPIHSFQRFDSVWGDGGVFRPERWLDPAGPAPADLLTNGWSSMLCFSDGPRNCIGYRLAIIEFKVILAMFIRHFQFGATGDPVIHKFASSMSPMVKGREKEGPQLPVTVAPL